MLLCASCPALRLRRCACASCSAHAALCNCSMQVALRKCAAQVALRKLLCASCSEQVARHKRSVASARAALRKCPLQVALRRPLCANLCASALCKLLYTSYFVQVALCECSVQVAPYEMLCASFPVQVALPTALRKLLCASCVAQVAKSFFTKDKQTKDKQTLQALQASNRSSSSRRAGMLVEWLPRRRCWLCADRSSTWLPHPSHASTNGSRHAGSYWGDCAEGGVAGVLFTVARSTWLPHLSSSSSV